jgi:formylglycine-generating enzyme required for sulfatase activity
MVLIPKGEFFMGSDDDDEGERPAHHVELSPYCIDLTEVTTARYQACSASGKCKRAAKTNEFPGITSHDREVFDRLCSAVDPDAQADHPITCVDWSMAQIFCESLPGGRLPTEAEWEFAARGPDGRRYPWGDEPPSAERLNACGSECVAWAKEMKVQLTAMYGADDSWPNTAQVGSFPKGKSPFGLLDVAGNVWEWVSDWHGPYGKGAEKNPTGPADGKLKVIRGGAWNGAVAGWVRPTFRFMAPPDSRSYGTGFRCAATPR